MGQGTSDYILGVIWIAVWIIWIHAWRRSALSESSCFYKCNNVQTKCFYHTALKGCQDIVKIAITHLWHAIAVAPQSMYHLIAKDKVAEQHI